MELKCLLNKTTLMETIHWYWYPNIIRIWFYEGFIYKYKYIFIYNKLDGLIARYNHRFYLICA